MKRWLMLLPLAIFLVVAVFLYRGLYLDPAELPSAMISRCSSGVFLTTS